ncbi:Cytochrome P450 [uncultured Mycobacterium sp.]|uniref:Cytochrome P450 n=1 Tax=uncultured Mycobacterium sp. TaxID=171292 RepID=A0A1Y5P0G0_9MYCO|nr:Cytochrome P450 [uncultured Mycobacterium sp.]
MTDVDSVNFFMDRDVVADPYPYLEALQARCPVSREPHKGVWMVTGWEEATEVAGDADRFSSCIAVTGPFPGFPVPVEGRDDVAELIAAHRDELPFNDQLPALDPPVHTDHRALLMRLITPKRLKENEDGMWTMVDRVLDDFLVGSGGELISGFAQPFTLVIIADLLGVPDADRDEFLAEMQRGGHHGGGIGSVKGESLAKSPLEYLYDKFIAYIEDRRANPRGDVLSEMAAATFPDGSVPDPGDVARVAANLYSAGQETTVRLLSAALQIIGDRPDIQAQLRADRSKVGNFIEEALRFEGPVKGDFRLSTVPVTLGGVDVPSGSTLMIVQAAANRDPRRFADPNTFDPARSNARQHIAFGRGIHSCPGAPLARAEARVALERLLDRTTDIRISEEHHGPADARKYNYVPTYILRGLTELHLEFDLA